MANPSVTNATAVGKEVIRRSYIDGAGETESTILTGVANHIMTVLSIIFHDRSGQSDNNFNMYIDYDLGGTDLYLVGAQEVGISGTFVWTDRFALTETDKLNMIGFSTTGTAQYDVWCTYIDQQFAAP